MHSNSVCKMGVELTRRESFPNGMGRSRANFLSTHRLLCTG